MRKDRAGNGLKLGLPGRLPVKLKRGRSLALEITDAQGVPARIRYIEGLRGFKTILIGFLVPRRVFNPYGTIKIKAETIVAVNLEDVPAGFFQANIPAHFQSDKTVGPALKDFAAAEAPV